MRHLIRTEGSAHPIEVPCTVSKSVSKKFLFHLGSGGRLNGLKLKARISLLSLLGDKLFLCMVVSLIF